MFTGIVTAVGTVVRLEPTDGLVRAWVDSPYDPGGVAIGASIAHAGCCLTVVERGPGPSGGMRHLVEIAAESLARTTLARLRQGDRLNLERSVRVGDELGGHLVAGHVDGVGEVVEVRPDGAGWRLGIDAPADLAPLIAAKGSIAVEGVSLTVNEVDGRRFGVLIIPHTWEATTLSALAPGAAVNLEADLIARYAARLLGWRGEGR